MTHLTPCGPSGTRPVSHGAYLARLQPKSATRLTAGFLGRPTQFDQFGDDCIAMIALNLNDALAHRTARAAALLELGRQRFDIGERQRQTGDGGNALSRPALDLASHAHGRGFGGTRNALGADAFADRPAAVWAQA